MSAAPRPPAFVNDLETCVGCHACVVACANENGLAPGTSWRHIVTHNAERRPGLPVFHLSLACNHCLDAPCLHHCPALAISRDPRTGAVLIDEGSCIGCRYCSWVCPYDAPRFDAGDGVMRKCTLCTHRLTQGLQPACVSLCPVGALTCGGLTPTFGEIRPQSSNQVGDRQKIEQIATNFDQLHDSPLPPGFPDAGIRPMIRFLPMRARALGADATAALDAAFPIPAGDTAPTPKISLRSEWSLAAFTSVAIVLAGLFLGWMIGGPRIPPLAFALAGLAAVGLSTAHLGRPLRAWRAGLNWRRSWLSREVISYSALVGLGTLALALDLPGGRLAWAATVAAALTLVSIDQVYVAMARQRRSLLDDHTAITGALFVAGLVSRQAALWLPLAAVRGATTVLRLATGLAPGGPRRTRQLALASARLLVGLAAPVALWFAAPPVPWWTAAALGVAGEALDRLSFYDHLAIVTPRSQMAEDEARSG